MNELAVANLSCLTANMNRDSTKRPEPFELRDFLVFRDREDDSAVLDAEVSAVALSLRHEDRCPPLVIATWPQIMASVKNGVVPPKVRALHSDDHSVWVLAPRWEGRNIRGGLVAVRGRICGEVTVRDLDKPLNVYRVLVPDRPGYGWLEARSLLVAPEN